MLVGPSVPLYPKIPKLLRMIRLKEMKLIQHEARSFAIKINELDFLFRINSSYTSSILYLSLSIWKHPRINRVDLKESICNYHKGGVQLSPKDTSFFLSPEVALETGAETHELTQHSLLTQAQSHGNEAIWSAGQSWPTSRQLEVQSEQTYSLLVSVHKNALTANISASGIHSGCLPA